MPEYQIIENNMEQETKITDIVEEGQLSAFMNILFFISQRSGDQQIVRVAKSLFHLLNVEKYANMENVEHLSTQSETHDEN